MQISTRKLIGLSVRTQSGESVGSVRELIVEGDTGRIEQFVVRTSGALSALIQPELMIGWAQVVTLTEEALVVMDSIVRRENRLAFGLTPTAPAE